MKYRGMGLGLAVSMMGLVGLLGLAGCGPGLSHRIQVPTPDAVNSNAGNGGQPENVAVFDAMDAELLHAIGTTTVTSAALPVPEVRLPLLAWDDTQPAPAATAPSAPCTWGEAPVLTANEAR